MLHISGFLTLRLSVCVSVCVSVNKVSKKILNQSTSFLVESFPCVPGRKPFDFEKKSPQGKGGGGGSKFGPNDMR